MDALRDRFHVMRTLIAPQADPHRVYEWARRGGHGGTFRVVYLNAGLTKPTWDYHERLVTVDRTYALDAAYDDIESGRWQPMPGVEGIDTGEFYAQMKAPKRERDVATGMLRYRWTETGALDHFRYAQAFDFLGSGYAILRMSFVS